MSSKAKIKKVANNISQEQNKHKVILTDIDKLNGIDAQDNKYLSVNKNEWPQCIYCDKFHHIDYYSSGMKYCIHCWAWLNGHEYDIESGVYSGIHSQNDINKTIKKSYFVHAEANCVNDECVFNKIKKYAEIQLLHPSLVELLELNKKPQQVAVCFNYKNKNLDVNFEESYIVI